MTRLLLFFVLLIPFGIRAQSFTSVEPVIGNQYGSFELRLIRPFSEKSRFTFFSKDYFTVKKTTYATTFNLLNTVSYGLNKNIGLAMSVQLIDQAAMLKAGLRLSQRAGGFYGYSIFSFDYAIVTKYSYIILLRQKLGWVYGQLDLLGSVGLSGNYLSSNQRARLGINLGTVQFGGAADFNERKAVATGTNFGVFLRKELNN